MFERKIGTIKEGVVIDHISSGKGVEIYKILALNDLNKFIVIANNLESKKLGKKDLIKIEGKELSQEELNKIALISKNSTINIIREGTVYKKYNVDFPKVIKNILLCNNPFCVTNIEKINTKILTKIEKEKTILKCYYCEKKQNEIKIKQ